jgi:dolichyl-phosphate-mannose--protein O-mannosyl transferase
VRLPKRILVTAALLFCFCQIFFLINIQFPKTPNFDEFHYVPSAKQFLAMTTNQNWEHPPLAKMLMAVGIGLWGDRPIGWRFMSTVFGSLTLVGMYLLAFVLFESEALALWVALLTLVNQLLYVQSRIGMLDTFMFAFLVWAMTAYCATWMLKITPKQTRYLLAFSGSMFGLSIACKWFAIVPWIACLGLMLVIRLLQKWETFFNHPNERDWYRSQLWKEVTWPYEVFALGILPLFFYFITFLPFFFIPGAASSPWDLIAMQTRMFDGQLRVVTSHPYMSHWVDWPLIRRPIWYAFDREGPAQAWVRGVILLGNPWIMWSGLLALIYCLWGWIKKRDRAAFLIVFFYVTFLACWIVIPRKVEFYYYYYPAGMVLSLALAYVFFDTKKSELPRWIFLGVAAGFFVYFFPILAAFRIPAEAFRNWMWFSSWI